MLNRREFQLRLATGLAACCASPVVSSVAAPERKRASKYIDVHTHVGTIWNGNKELTPSLLVRWMDEHDVEKAVVLPLTSPESSSFLCLTEGALQAAKEFPDRLIPFCSIDPRTSVVGGARGFETIIRRYVDLGAKGFGEHKVGLDFDDPLMMQIYEVCEKIGIPLLFHMDTIRGKDQPGLPRLAHALATFPKLAFIGHGPGWWASISGDAKASDFMSSAPRRVTAGGAIDKLMDTYPNLWGDLSAGSGAQALSRDLVFGRQFLIRRQNRLLFGTDYLQPGQPVPQFQILESLNLPADVQQKIFRRNAEALLKLS
ncbi:MAG TPA: amidohydrolase family protein [Planctomycetaceae bacterium]|jgi:predicted TIM-barrel fold metal-dependent hydrolase|nr:amidohydrolase family protein [Planctomycetaceae bacterium]